MTWLLNSKKCSTAKNRAPWLATLTLCLCVGPNALASPAPSRPLVGKPNTISLKKEIQAAQSRDFDPLLARWSKTYGTGAVLPLSDIATDPKGADRERYVAIMGLAKLGGKATSPLIQKLLKDSSWMVRTASLRALVALDDRTAATTILNSLSDPALLVRLEAVHAVRKLRPAGASQSLAATLSNPENYQRGQPLFVPQKALDAIAELRSPEAIPSLLTFLDRTRNSELRKQTLATIQTLAGIKKARVGSIEQQIQDLKKSLKK